MASSAHRPFEPPDLLLEQRIDAFDVAADGRWAVCAVNAPDPARDGYTSQLWRLPLDGSALPQWPFTQAGCRDTAPAPSPDGRQIAFLSDRHGGPPQVHLMPSDGGEARPLTRFACPVIDLAWRPDGTQLALVCGFAVDPGQRAAGTHDLDLQRPPRPDNAPELAWRLPYKRDGSGYTLGRRLHLVLVDADSGAPLQVLTRGDFDVAEIAWSPDGRLLAYGRSREALGETHCSDLWCLDLAPDGTPGTPRRLTHDIATAGAPAWSPDGRQLAFTGAREAGNAVLLLWRCLLEGDGGRAERLGGDDAEVAPGVRPCWHGDARRVAFAQAWHGLQRIAVVDTDTGGLSVAVQHDTGQVAALRTAAGRLVYTLEGVEQPLELYTADWQGGAAHRVSHLNAWWDQRQPPQVQRRTFTVPDGRGGQERIEGWLFLPQGCRQAMPLLVEVHGGPASYVLLAFPQGAYRQVLVSHAGTEAELVLYPGGTHHVIGQVPPSHRLDALQRIVGWLQRWIDTPLPVPQESPP
jgi:dipeptidyl aminopeptidase/acylaminoacyl peptidase